MEGPAVSAIYAADNDYHMGIPRENVAKNKAPHGRHDNGLLLGKKCRRQLIELRCIFCVDLVLAFRKYMKQ